VQFELLDMTDSTAVAAFSQRLGGDVNMHASTILHLIKEKHRAAIADNLLVALIGERGVFYFYETDGTALDYFLTKPADSVSGLPAGMHAAIEHGIMPSGFGAEAHGQWFSDPNKWETISWGATTITTIAFADGEAGAVPAFFALLRAPPTTEHQCEVNISSADEETTIDDEQDVQDAL
jgi:hypothetical protein